MSTISSKRPDIHCKSAQMREEGQKRRYTELGRRRFRVTNSDDVVVEGWMGEGVLTSEQRPDIPKKDHNRTTMRVDVGYPSVGE